MEPNVMEPALNCLYVLYAAAIAFVSVTVIAFLLRQEAKAPLSASHKLLMAFHRRLHPGNGEAIDLKMGA